MAEAVGEGVSGVAPGDRVAYTLPLGAYASARALPAGRLVRLPEGIGDELAATLMLKGLSAHYLVHDCAPVEAGMSVLVHATAGGVGLLFGQWLHAKGAVAIGAAGGPEKAALAAEHGYDRVIDYRADDFVERVRAITGGEGVDAVFEGVGRDIWRGSLDALRVRGRFVYFGQASGPVEGFGLPDLARKSLIAQRSALFHVIAAPEERRVRAADLFTAVASGALRPEVRQRFALAEAAEAHRALEGRATVGATVLVP